MGSPYEVEVHESWAVCTTRQGVIPSPTNFPHSSVEGPGLLGAIAGEPASFTIQANDQYGNAEVCATGVNREREVRRDIHGHISRRVRSVD